MNRTFALALTLGVLAPSTILAQQPPDPPPTVITLRPAGEPIPALKYRLVPERRSLISGNAAVFYHRALLMLGTHQARLADKSDDGITRLDMLAISRWIVEPIAQIPIDEARKQLALVESVLHEVKLGATRSNCDWEFDQRTEGINLLLPEIQEMRSLARLVALKARVVILDGKTDEAMDWIETGLVMGRHVSQAPWIIPALVGIAIDSVMMQCIHDLIQVPGTPSLYWALADRPHPFIDMRYAFEGERFVLEKELPELKNLDREAWSLEEARQFSDQMQRKLATFSSMGTGDGQAARLTSQLGMASMAAKIYPQAKLALMARGRSEAQVEAMPIIQVATLYTLHEYQRIRDDTYKAMNLPYWQSSQRSDFSNFLKVEEKLANPLLTLFQQLIPALNSARLAGVRNERKFDALQCIEAIRLYAGTHDGKLPASLEAMTETPAPLDPGTGKPFVYKVDGDTATLSAPVPLGAPVHPSYMINYLLRLTK